MITVSIGPLLWGCTSAQIAQPTSEAKAAPEPVRNAWNPAIASDPNGYLYLTYYGSSGSDRTSLYFNRSLDGGTTWLPEPIRVDSTESRGTRFGFHGVETNGQGIVSVTWSIEGTADKYWRVQEVRRRQSRDFGATWPGAHLAWRFERPSNFPIPRSGAEGEWYLFWVEKAAEGANGLLFNRTSQGGDAWSRAPIALRQHEGHTKLSDTGTRRLRSRLPEIAWPTLATDGRGRFYLAWQELPPGEGSLIFFNRSLDGGETWLEAAPRVSTNPFAQVSRNPQVAFDGAGGVYVVWEDSRNNATDVYLNRSWDNGLTWLPEDLRITVDRPAEGRSSLPVIFADPSGHVYVAWEEHREVPYMLYFNRSEDRGQTWLPHPTRLDRHGKGARTYGFQLWNDAPGHVYAAWLERGKTEDSIRFNRSSDYGATWLDADVRIDSDNAGKGESSLRYPRRSADTTGKLYVVWSSDQKTGYKLFLNRSTDHGATWLPREIQITR
jgi:hypothetical protein